MIFRFGDYELTEHPPALRSRGAKVAVQPKVLQLLVYLVRHRDRAVPREELFQAIWPEVTVAETSLTRAVVEARRAIGDLAQEGIATVRGYGFRFMTPVIELSREPSGQAPPALVGREACMAALGAQIEGALAGRSTALWISGVSGMGKTRVLEEVALQARRRGLLAYLTHCHETASQPPFWAWVSLGRSLASALEGGAPGLAEALGKLEASAGLPAFDAVARAFVGVAKTHPLVLMVDDLHWADDGTLALAGYLAREVRDAPLLLLGAYREGVVAEDGRARGFASFLREHGDRALPLRGLSREETARLVEALEGRMPSGRLAAAIHEKTGGCPLFVQQILKTEWAAGALKNEALSAATSIDLQEGLVESIGRHLDGISPACRDVLAWAAVLGKEFDVAALVAVTGLDAAALLDRLEEAARSRILKATGDGHYRFDLPLLADVLYKKLPASERASRHRAIGAFLEARYATALDAHAHRIARHYVRAAPTGTAREAFDFSSRAARHASARRDAPSAVKHWERAAQVLDLLAGSERERLSVLEALGGARAATGDVEGAREAYFDAAVLARALGDRARLAEVAAAARALPQGDPRVEALLHGE